MNFCAVSGYLGVKVSIGYLDLGFAASNGKLFL